ncbi:MAG: enoyl-CoA hydratase/isomerase family protein [Syntrophales bacterium]|jgi:enoyl-CoA hydratase/carnithine racemase|nr:enoyl-CoA hydratase/isomerase family protein [Syntrophales bacterium]HOG06881.1 enoyl-CoA hydratase/isomerase family protein [Syntrophales bacterium]HOS77147.1 enoyl-CoA hydratase/isomerase family protein [Syntrophales bacterium]HPB70773.1 enoyl-CoA hydratase/isomerase family protein [Syntrophales bacterium]HQN24840.1 enoyl-CoA hydratase/isomerase family protein [Syntrophales bacterium]
MTVVEWKKEETIAVITMTHGENRHNPVFVEAILKVFDEIEQDPSVTSAVITSDDPKNWSQGIDLTWIMSAYGEKRLQEIKDFMYGLNRMFKRILLIPMPVIAAINGHAFGDGAIMACCCDFRFMRADRGFFCFPEIDISIPFLPGMLAIVKKAFPYYKLEEAAFSGKRYGGAELEMHHVVVKACADSEALLADAISFGKTFNKKRPIYGEMKKRFHKEIIRTIDTEDPAFIEPLALML